MIPDELFNLFYSGLVTVNLNKSQAYISRIVKVRQVDTAPGGM